MHTRTAHPRRTRFWLGAALALLLSLVSATPALADDDKNNDNGNHGGKRIVVSPENMRGWVFAPDPRNTPGTGRMEAGPADPPSGQGSAELRVNIPTDGFILAKAAYQGTFLRDFTRLDYWTYRTSPTAGVVQIALQFNVDKDLTDGIEGFQGRIVYEPYYSHPTEAMQAGVWHHWNTQDNDGSPNGSWWFTRPLLFPGCTIADPCTWAEVLALYPNAGVHRTLGAVILKAGSGWAAFEGNIDALTIGCNGRTITWNFEPSDDKDKKDKHDNRSLCGNGNHGEDDEDEDDD